MTVKRNIAFPPKIRRYDTDRIDSRVEEMLELVRLPDIADRQVSQLSGGQQQRVVIARALAFEPPILLLDEPLSSLDKNLREEMRAELSRIREEAGMTTIHVTHNQEEALTMADRVVVIKDGQIAQLSETQTLYAEPESAFIADFVGNTNLFTGTVVEQEGGEDVIRIDGSEFEIRCLSQTGVERDRTVDIGIRHEQIRVDSDPTGTENEYRGEVTDVTFKGDMISYNVATPTLDTDFVVTNLNDDTTRVFSHGDPVYFGWNTDDVHVYGQ